MKPRSVLAFFLLAALFLFSGCGGDDVPNVVCRSENYSFTADMAAYMAAYTKLALADEMAAAVMDDSKPLAGQTSADGESFEDYLFEVTVQNIEKILLYCEAARADGYVPGEGMIYKANETVTYLSSKAEEAGMTAEEYLKESFGDKVTLSGYQTCVEMMVLCEGYELSLISAEEVTSDEAEAYADSHSGDFLKFDALRYSTSDRELAEMLASSETSEDFLKIISSVSGISVTDKNKNKIPDEIEVYAAVSADPAGEFASEEGRSRWDTYMSESDGSYTVTMLLTLPHRDEEPVWNFRALYISSESNSDPMYEAESLLEQWKEKQGGETGFSNLAARYSDNPTAYYGGLFSGISRDDMPSTKVADWICSSGRIAGDTAVVDDGDDGAYMLYYIDGNIPRWKYTASQAVKAERIDQKMSESEEEIKKSFVFDNDALRKLIK